MEEDFIDFKCPYCGDPVSFPEPCRGLLQECPGCAESVIVPADGSGVGRQPPLPLTTDRLVLRRLRGTDWKDLLELTSDEELFRYLEGRPLSEEEILQWLENDRHAKLTTPNQTFCLGMELRDGGKLVGYLSLGFTEPQRLQAGFNLFLSRSCQRKGLAAEALAAMLDFCFAGINLHRVTALCDSRHAAACRLFEKTGLRREGEFLKDHRLNDEWANSVHYALLKEEYRRPVTAPGPDCL